MLDIGGERSFWPTEEVEEEGVYVRTFSGGRWQRSGDELLNPVRAFG